MPATRDLNGRTALLTGASRGLGELIACRLLAEGMKVALAARSRGDLDAVRSRLDPAGSSTLAVLCDVADPAQCERAVATAEAAWDGLDVLINNAGIEQPEAFADTEVAIVRQVIETNVIGLLQMTRAALPGMLARRHGHVLNMASVAGLTPVPFNTVYSASKHAVVGFTDSLRLELRGTGVDVSMVSPGYVREVGMFTRYPQQAPAVAGTVSPGQVVDAVVTALKRNRRNVVVIPAAGKLSPVLRAVAPGAIGPIMRASGVMRMLEDAARYTTAHKGE